MLVAGVSLAACALAGCATTQQQAARRQLVSTRERASEQAVHVLRTDPAVAATATVVRSASGSAIVVRLRNLSGHTVSDLPITVAIRGPHGRLNILNAVGGLDYFLTHIPAVAPRGALTWVFPAGRRLPSGPAVARVGNPAAGAGSTSVAGGSLPDALPRITVRLLGVVRHGAARLAVSNQSDVPQYGLQVYAVTATRGDLTAAGRGTIGELDGGSTGQLRIALRGNPGRAAVTAQAAPTELR